MTINERKGAIFSIAHTVTLHALCTNYITFAAKTIGLPAQTQTPQPSSSGQKGNTKASGNTVSTPLLGKHSYSDVFDRKPKLQRRMYVEG
jgi:hypothetical protein